MNAAAQITGNTFSKPTVAGNAQQLPAGGQEFNVLVQMLASFLEANSTSAAGGQGSADSTANIDSQQAAASGSSSSPADSTSIAKDFLELMSELNPQAGKSADPKTDEAKQGTYPLVASPQISLPQLLNAFAKQSGDSSITVSSAPQIPAKILSQLNQQLASYLSSGQYVSQDSTQVFPDNIATTNADSNGSDSKVDDSQKADQQNLSGTVKSDLMNLLSKISGSDTDPAALRNLENLLNQSSPDVTSAELAQKLKNYSAATTANQQGSGVNSASMTPGGSVSQQASGMQSNTDSILSQIPTLSQGNASGKSTVPAKAGASVVEMNSTPPVAVPAANIVSSTQVKNDVSVTQTSNGGSLQLQDARVGDVQPGQSKQDSSNAGGNFSELMKQNAVQAYVNSLDNGKANFNQALSAASQNSSAPSLKPDINLIAQSIVKEANLMTQQGKTVVSMKLQPEDLGTVVLKVSSESGKISAEFNVKSPDARAFLETSIPQMKQALQTNGITLSHLSVSLSGGEFQNRHPQYQNAKRHARYYSDAAPEPAEAARNFGYNTIELKV